MKKIYLVKKDPSLPVSEENWILMDGCGFKAFLKTDEGQKRGRGMGRLDALDSGDACIFIECGEEEAKRWHRRRARRHYRSVMETGVCLLDDLPCTEGDCAPAGTEPADPDCDVEETVLRRGDLESLRRALGSLSGEELNLIRDLFYRDPPLTLAVCAAALGVSPQALQKRKRRILRKLREKMEAGGRGLPEKGEDPGTGVRRK